MVCNQFNRDPLAEIEVFDMVVHTVDRIAVVEIHSVNKRRTDVLP